MLIYTWKLSVLIFLLSDRESLGYEEKVTISRHYLGDMFFGHESTCRDDYCDSGGVRFAKTIRHGSCQCQCSSSTPVFRDDLQTCVKDVEECLLADYVSASSTEKIPFVFLPHKGHLIYPDAEIALSDMRSEGQLLLSPVCVVSKAHILSSKGWIALEKGTVGEPPFALYREGTKTYLQWLGDGSLRISLDGRVILVRLLCKDTANARIGVFSPCIAFRVAGSPGVAEVVFDGGTVDIGQSGPGSIIHQSNYVAIGIASGVLGLLYVIGVVIFLTNRRKKRRGKAREAKLNSISSPFVDDGILKTNPLLHSNNSNGDSKSINTPLVNQKEAMALFQDAARRHLSPSGLCSPDLCHAGRNQLGGSLLPGQVPHFEEDLLEAQLFQAGFDPAHLTKEDREYILSQRYLDQSSFEGQAPEFLARVRSAVDSARLKMSSRKFLPRLFDIPEEPRDYGSVSKQSQISRTNSVKKQHKQEGTSEGRKFLGSTDSGANGDASDSSQNKSNTDESNQPIYIPRKKKLIKEKDTAYGSIKKNLTSTLDRVKKSLSKDEERNENDKNDISMSRSLYTNPSIESIYGSLFKKKDENEEGKKAEIEQQNDSRPSTRATFVNMKKQPLYDMLKISETQPEHMKPAERVCDKTEGVTCLMQTEATPAKPLMVEKSTYTTMTIMRGSANEVDVILSDAESKVPKLSSDSESESIGCKQFQKKIWFEPDSLDRPRRPFETPSITVVKSFKTKPERSESKVTQRMKEVPRKLQTSKAAFQKSDPTASTTEAATSKVAQLVKEAPNKCQTSEAAFEGCDSTGSTCKSVKSLSRVLPGGDELEIGNDLFNMNTGFATLKKSGIKNPGTLDIRKKGNRKKPITKTDLGDLSDVSTTSKHERWDLAGDPNWFAKPKDITRESGHSKGENFSPITGHRDNFSSSQSKFEWGEFEMQHNYLSRDDGNPGTAMREGIFGPDFLENHGTVSKRQRQNFSSANCGRNQSEKYVVPKRNLKKEDFEVLKSKAKAENESPVKNKIALARFHSSPVPILERMVDESPALPLKSLRQMFESSEEAKCDAPPRPQKGIDMQRLNQELNRQNKLHNPAEKRKETIYDSPPKLPPRKGGTGPPSLPPKSLHRRSASLDELMDYEPIGSVKSNTSLYDDTKSTSSVHELLQRIEEFEKEEAYLRQSHLVSENGTISESGISKVSNSSW
ncbi:hypothetical protein QYM36_008114 [Artemia franciscana]|uniref:Shavenoid isoform B-like N-terminal domain-containing protein n=1 Tax=Artemia franciscana TaxID=6661 RepID=A0AA88IP86_ARTSF|nr:hypothetical protein QYM36_008114 [Artemia franciscana]